jgi:hypothetical protein
VSASFWRDAGAPALPLFSKLRSGHCGYSTKTFCFQLTVGVQKDNWFFVWTFAAFAAARTNRLYISGCIEELLSRKCLFQY